MSNLPIRGAEAGAPRQPTAPDRSRELPGRSPSTFAVLLRGSSAPSFRASCASALAALRGAAVEAGAGEPLAPGAGAKRARHGEGNEQGDNDAPLAPPAAAHLGDECGDLDPMARALRTPFMGPASAAAPPALSERQDPIAQASRVSLDDLMNRFVKRVAWSGDAQSGSARIEFGAGQLEGATLTLHAQHGALQVSLELPPGVDRAAWRERIERRLSARGLQVDSLEVG